MKYLNDFKTICDWLKIMVNNGYHNIWKEQPIYCSKTTFASIKLVCLIKIKFYVSLVLGFGTKKENFHTYTNDSCS